MNSQRVMWYIVKWNSPQNPPETFKIMAANATNAKARIVNHLRKQHVHYAEMDQMEIIREILA